jgi:hypothetical protein
MIGRVVIQAYARAQKYSESEIRKIESDVEKAYRVVVYCSSEGRRVQKENSMDKEWEAGNLILTRTRRHRGIDQ